MQIDWFTVGAQALNFLILAWLLKRFLYKPVLDAIDAREQLIARQLAQAQAEESEARQERDTYRQKNAHFEDKRDALLSQASDEAKAERQRLLDLARQEADDLQTAARHALNDELQHLQHDIARRSREEAFAIARKMLGDLADTTLEERISSVFVRRLRVLDGALKDNLIKAIATSPDPVLVRCGVALPAQQQAQIRHAINDTLDPLASALAVHFQTDPDIISGIELSVSGRKVAWSIADHLDALEKSAAAAAANNPATTNNNNNNNNTPEESA
jgi:F-type H+-transporting ATPase subunit b